eukprot:11181630-Lingulodinium_polyedra.AAC.1
MDCCGRCGPGEPPRPHGAGYQPPAFLHARRPAEGAGVLMPLSGNTIQHSTVQYSTVQCSTVQ